MWHDMLSHMSQKQLKLLAQQGKPEVVLWAYGNIEQQLPADLWGRLHASGLNVWGASAFRGASLPDALWTPTPVHVTNHLQWHQKLREQQQSGKTPLSGMILTGWSRFCGAAALCDSTPAGWPSLLACVAALASGNACLQQPKTFNSIAQQFLGGLSPTVWLSSGCEEGLAAFVRRGNRVYLLFLLEK
jgi:hypothetical protein